MSYSRSDLTPLIHHVATHDVFSELRTGDILGETVCEVGEERDVEKVKEQLESAWACIYQ